VKDPSLVAIEAADAKFAAHATASERYSARARTAPRLQVLAYHEATLALLEAQTSAMCRPGQSYCPPQLSAANQARLPQIQETVHRGRPPITVPPTTWTIDGDRSCLPLIAGLRAQAVDSSPAQAATLTLARCDLRIDGHPWVASTCNEVGSEAFQPCPSAPMPPRQQLAPDDNVPVPREPRPAMFDCPCHRWTAEVRVAVEGTVSFAGRTMPFRHVWTDVVTERVVDRPRAPPLQPPTWPTVDQLVSQTIAGGSDPSLAYAAHAIEVLAAPADRDALLLACLDLPPRYYSRQPLDFDLYDAAATRCKSLY
jgi:hypothetical protein